MFRRQDWRTRLQRWAAAQQGKAFEWGVTDCAALARAALLEMFGDGIERYLPQWSSVREAVTILQARGSIGAILEELGATRTTVPFMRAGDLVLSAEPDEEIGRVSVMVCIDAQQCLASTREGVCMLNPLPQSVVFSLWEVALG